MSRIDQVIREWARQARPARAYRGYSVSFSGCRLYSYSTEIARLLDPVGGIRRGWITSRKYSVTTTRHTAAARAACARAVDQIVCLDHCPDSAEITDMVKCAKDYADLMGHTYYDTDLLCEIPDAGALLALRSSLPPAIDQIQLIADRVSDRLALQVQPVAIGACIRADEHIALVIRAGESQQTWYDLAHVLAHRLNRQDPRCHGRAHGALWARRVRRIGGMIVKEFTRLARAGKLHDNPQV